MNSQTDPELNSNHYDVFIIGGGVNGAGIARDAIGRGFTVCLCDANGFASGTSSASTKLIHGGLRYLEYLEVRLVREALHEREILLKAMPHISRPMRFVLPLHPDMRFEGETTVSRILSIAMPWLKGRRPNWMIRLGLFFYDHLGGGKFLPKTTTLSLGEDVAGECLKPAFEKAFEYSDGWVDDARLVILNLLDARDRGAQLFPHTKIHTAHHDGNRWQLELKNSTDGASSRVSALMIVNAAGPWADEVLKSVFEVKNAKNLRLVRGSHIVIPQRFSHNKSYLFQNADSRIMFAIPWLGKYTLIGTTDADHDDINQSPQISDAEIDYLCEQASVWFKQPVMREEIIWTYAGVRALYDDGSKDARSATRDYVLRPEIAAGEGSLINIFGGKITTYRKLANAMMGLLEDRLGERGPAWTNDAPLPGGDFQFGGFARLLADKCGRYKFLQLEVVERLLRTHGTRIDLVLNNASSAKKLGKEIIPGLYEIELRYFMQVEWATTAHEVLFLRTKLGVALSKSNIEKVEKAMKRLQAEIAT